MGEMSLLRQFPSGGSKVLRFDGSLSGSVLDLAALAGTPDAAWRNFTVDSLGSLIAACYYDGTNYKLVVGTLSGTTITWGTALTVAAVAGQPAVKIISSSLLIIGYRDTEGTPKFECKTYGISGTVLTLDQTVNIASIYTSNNALSFAVVSSTRVVAAYANTSHYPTVIGLTVGAGVLTADGAAVVVQSAALAGSDLNIDYLGSTKLIVTYVISAVIRCAIITDATTSTSAAAAYDVVAAGSNGASLTCGGSKTFLAASHQSQEGQIYAFRHSGGAVDSEFLKTSASDAIFTAARGMASALTSEVRGAVLGDVDGDGVIWSLILVGVGGSPYSDIYGLFIGFNGTTGTPQGTMSQSVKLLKATSGRAERYGRVVAINTVTFIVFWIDEVNADYKYQVHKL